MSSFHSVLNAYNPTTEEAEAEDAEFEVSSRPYLKHKQHLYVKLSDRELA